MLKSTGNKLIMDRNDFGETLPITLSGITFENYDKIDFVIKKAPNSYTILTKEYSNATPDATDFSFLLSFTEKESKQLKPGSYVYYVILKRDKELQNTLISGETFTVR